MSFSGFGHARILALVLLYAIDGEVSNWLRFCLFVQKGCGMVAVCWLTLHCRAWGRIGGAAIEGTALCFSTLTGYIDIVGM